MSPRLGLALEHLVLTEEDAPARRDAAVAPLVARAQAGDREAFGALVARFQDKVLATAWRLLRHREDALDAAQEAFLRAHKYLGGFDPRAADFGAWLHRIVVNVSRDVGARRGREAAVPFDDGRAAPPEGPDERGDPEARAGARDAGRLLARAMATLTERERAAFVMRDLEGISTEEVARALGSTATTVRVHLCMARKKLRRAIEEDVAPGEPRAAEGVKPGGDGR
jgi:RNA polymerase sigma-70 factor (ECF subfamily)